MKKDVCDQKNTGKSALMHIKNIKQEVNKMLVLSRRVGESIVIGDEIFFTVLGFKGNQVSLGFDAPDSVTIHRNEIYQKIKAENSGLFMPNQYFPPAQNEWVENSVNSFASSNF